MSALLVDASLVVGAAAIVAGLLVLVSTRSLAAALPVLLDLLLAAGLLRLSAAETWGAIGAAAAVVLIRRLAVAGINAPSRWSSSAAFRSARRP